MGVGTSSRMRHPSCDIPVMSSLPTHNVLAVAMESGVKVQKAAHFLAFSVLVAMAIGINRYRNSENHKKKSKLHILSVIQFMTTVLKITKKYVESNF